MATQSLVEEKSALSDTQRELSTSKQIVDQLKQVCF